MPPRDPENRKVFSLKAWRFGQWLKTRRADLDESLTILADRSGASRAGLSNYENGITDPLSTDLRMVRRLAIAYKIKPEIILKRLLPELEDKC